MLQQVKILFDDCAERNKRHEPGYESIINLLKTRLKELVGDRYWEERPSIHLNKFGPEVKYKKAPQAPKRFKSSYIFFSTIKHKEIRAELTQNAQEGGRKVSHIVVEWNCIDCI